MQWSFEPFFRATLKTLKSSINMIVQHWNKIQHHVIDFQLKKNFNLYRRANNNKYALTTGACSPALQHDNFEQNIEQTFDCLLSFFCSFSRKNKQMLNLTGASIETQSNSYNNKCFKREKTSLITNMKCNYLSWFSQFMRIKFSTHWNARSCALNTMCTVRFVWLMQFI